MQIKPRDNIFHHQTARSMTVTSTLKRRDTQRAIWNDSSSEAKTAVLDGVDHSSWGGGGGEEGGKSE